MFKETKAFDEELKDLDIEYRKKAVTNAHRIDAFMPSMIFYLRQFLELHDEQESIRVKQKTLQDKLSVFNQCEEC